MRYSQLPIFNVWKIYVLVACSFLEICNFCSASNSVKEVSVTADDVAGVLNIDVKRFAVDTPTPVYAKVTLLYQPQKGNTEKHSISTNSPQKTFNIFYSSLPENLNSARKVQSESSKIVCAIKLLNGGELVVSIPDEFRQKSGYYFWKTDMTQHVALDKDIVLYQQGVHQNEFNTYIRLILRLSATAFTQE